MRVEITVHGLEEEDYVEKLEKIEEFIESLGLGSWVGIVEDDQ